MEQSELKKQALQLLNRTDFKNLATADALRLTSIINKMPAELAKEVIAQYPELANLIGSLISEYQKGQKEVLDSDDQSLKQLYELYTKTLESDSHAESLLIDQANSVQDSLDKFLEHGNLTPEAVRIAELKVEALKLEYEKDSEIRQEKERVLDRAERKDSEKRRFHKELLRFGSLVAIAGIAIGASILGGDFHLNLPDKT